MELDYAKLNQTYSYQRQRAGVGRIGGRCSTGTDFQLYKNNTRDVIYNMMARANTAM